MMEWDRPGWAGRRVRELIHASLGVVTLAFWIALLALVYTAIFTQRPTSDLQITVIALAGIHAGRRIGEKWVAAQQNGPQSETAKKEAKVSEP